MFAPCARWDLLSKDNLWCYVKGSNALLVRYPHEVDFISQSCYPLSLMPDIDVTAYDVLLTSPCGVFFQQSVAKHWDLMAPAGLPRDPLRLLSRCLDDYESAKRRNAPGMPCGPCETSFRDRISQLRLELWAELPTLFSIDELQQLSCKSVYTDVPPVR